MHHMQAKAPQLTWAGRGVGDGDGDGDDGCNVELGTIVCGGMRLARVPAVHCRRHRPRQTIGREDVD